jgi:hypothetical protein
VDFPTLGRPTMPMPSAMEASFEMKNGPGGPGGPAGAGEA